MADTLMAQWAAQAAQAAKQPAPTGIPASGTQPQTLMGQWAAAAAKQAAIEPTGKTVPDINPKGVAYNAILNSGLNMIPGGQPIIGAGETALSALTGTAGQLSGDIANVGASAGKAMGLYHGDPQALGDKIAAAMTYKPTSDTGQLLSGAIGKAYGATLGKVRNAAVTATQNNWLPPNPLTGLMGSFQKTRPLAAAEVGSYADVLPMLLGQRSAATDLPLTPTAAAVKEGFTVNPSFASIKGANAPFGKLMEGLGGGARLSVENAVKNANITSKIANEHLGLPETRILTPETLEELRAPHNAVYQEIDNIPSIPMDKTYQQDLIGAERTPTRIRTNMSDKIQALQKQYNVPEMTGAEANIYIKDLRGNARTNYLASKSPNVENAASLKNLAYAQNHIASAIEDQIERHLNPGQEALAPISAQSTEAPTIGNDLLQRFRNARKSLAVINTYERAIKPGTTDVIPAKLAKEYNKSPKKYAGTPVEKIAQTYNNFPHEMHDAATYRGKTPVNYGDILLAWLGKNVASGAEPHSMGAGVAAGVAGATIRPALRALLKSRAYQKGLAGLPRRNILAPIPPLGQLNGQKNP